MVSSSCAVQALRIIQLHREQYSIAIRGDLIVIGLLAIATTADGARLAPECRMGRGPARRLREDGSSASARHKTERICLEPEAIRIRQPVNTFVGDGGELADNMMSLFSSARIVPAALVGLPESTCTSESAVAMHSLLDTAREGRCRGVEGFGGFGHREGAVEAALARVEGRMQSVVPEEEQREGRQLREALKPRNDILRTFFEAPAKHPLQQARKWWRSCSAARRGCGRKRCAALAAAHQQCGVLIDRNFRIAVLAGASTDGGRRSAARAGSEISPVCCCE